MNSLKHITDWPAAGSSVDWKGMRQRSGQDRFQTPINKECPSCSSGALKSSYSEYDKTTFQGQMSGIRGASRTYEIRGTRVIANWDQTNTSIHVYELYINDGGGFNVAKSTDLERCGMDWFISGQNSSTTIKENISGSVPFPGSNTVVSYPGETPITRIFLIAAKPNIIVDFKLQLVISNCKENKHNDDVSYDITLRNDDLVTSTNVSNEPEPLLPCSFEIDGPKSINCDEYAIYGPVNPDLASGAYYSYELYGNSEYWQIIGGKNSESILLKSPTYNNLFNNPGIESVLLCVTKFQPGICEPTTLCKKITIDNCPIPRAEVDRNIFTVGGRVFGNRGGITTPVDWPAIYKERVWPDRN